MARFRAARRRRRAPKHLCTCGCQQLVTIKTLKFHMLRHSSRRREHTEESAASGDRMNAERDEDGGQHQYGLVDDEPDMSGINRNCCDDGTLKSQNGILHEDEEDVSVLQTDDDPSVTETSKKICEDIIGVDLSGTPIKGSLMSISSLLQHCCFRKSPSIAFFILATSVMCCTFTLSDSFLKEAWSVSTTFAQEYAKEILAAVQVGANYCRIAGALQRRGYLSLPTSWSSARSLLGLTPGASSAGHFTVEIVCCPKCRKNYPLEEAKRIRMCTFVRFPRHSQRSHRKQCGASLFDRHQKPKMTLAYAPLTNSIARMLQRPKFESDLLHHWTARPGLSDKSAHPNDLMRDVYEGDVFRKFSKVLSPNDEYLGVKSTSGSRRA